MCPRLAPGVSLQNLLFLVFMILFDGICILQLHLSEVSALTLTPLFLCTLCPVCQHTPPALPSDYILNSQTAPPTMPPNPGHRTSSLGYIRCLSACLPTSTLALSLHCLHMAECSVKTVSPLSLPVHIPPVALNLT